jgi:hypothetical protein
MINAQKLISNNNVDDLRDDMFPREQVQFLGAYDAIVTPEDRCSYAMELVILSVI